MNKEIRVWDPLVRIFHWSLVLGFTVAFLTGDEEKNAHIYAGYVVLGLISFRVIWGLVGTKHARFSDFIYSPATVIRYLKGLFAFSPGHYRGHNPAGGWMVVLMLITLFAVSWTGMKAYAVAEGKGPLAGHYPGVSVISIAQADSNERDHENNEHRGDHGEGGEDEEEDEFWEELHEAASNFMLFLVALHIMGVVVSGYIHRENLVKAMITGCKKE